MMYIYCRYPAVFWKTNKALSFLFSVQLVGNGLQSLMAFAAMSIMFKVNDKLKLSKWLKVSEISGNEPL